MRWKRIALVTAGLMIAGGVFGTIAGMLVLTAWMAVMEGPGAVFDGLGFLLELSLAFGGGLGAVLGPLAAWVFMRHVPLWLAVGGTTLGTLASGGLALLLTGNPINAMLFGILGFGVSTLLVRNHVPRAERRLAAAQPADVEALPG
jgi:hypothetical protein